ncbi:MAG: glycerol-3-phosphate acyltransferase [Clostridia bacterium]|nr:glycerol-3-phosphate acyltransferase [Clostridia bacterium]
MMSNFWLLLIFGVASYLFGNINWALIISKLKKTDIRKLGSGNPGTLNMSRNLGLKFGLLTFFLDILKGAIPTLVVFFVCAQRKFIGTDFLVADFAVFLCGLCAVLGHIYPIMLKFKGGKGIATTIGVFLVCTSVYGWMWAVITIMALVAAAIFIYFTEFGAMGSFIAITPPAVGSCIRLFLTYNKTSLVATTTFHVIVNMFIFAICLFTWFAHRRNIERMLAGEEHPTSIKEMVVKAKLKKAQARKQNAENQDFND